MGHPELSKFSFHHNEGRLRRDIKFHLTRNGFLPGKFRGQRGLAGYSPWGRKKMDMTEYTHTQKELELTFLASDLWSTICTCCRSLSDDSRNPTTILPLIILANLNGTLMKHKARF